MWFWKHGVLLACTLVTTRLHNIDIEISMFTFTCTHHTCMNREHKTGSLNWMLHLYFTGGSFLMTLANKISWKVTDRQHSDDGYVLFIVFFLCLVCFIYHLLIFTCVQTEMNCCHHSWEWSLCIWGKFGAPQRSIEVWWISGMKSVSFWELILRHTKTMFETLPHCCFKWVLTFWSTNLWHSIWS